jgi:hypothetical protein
MNRRTLEPHPGEVATIADLESDLEAALRALRELDSRGRLPRELRALLELAPPEGTSVHVSLRERDGGRQLRSSAAARSFSYRHCGVWIVFEVPQALYSEPSARSSSVADALPEFVTALDQAEHEPHLHFVSLKWFRDTYLIKRGHAWAHDPEIPRRLIQHATESDLILTSKVPNPKTPDYPVTSIRLNREHPEVVRILAAQATGRQASAPYGEGRANEPERRADPDDQPESSRDTDP